MSTIKPDPTYAIKIPCFVRKDKSLVKQEKQQPIITNLSEKANRRNNRLENKLKVIKSSFVFLLNSAIKYVQTHILLLNLVQQWSWVTSSHNLSYDPSPTM